MPVRYFDAAQLARVLDVDREWVYQHARQLGGIRLGNGRGRLRFDLKHVTRVLAIPRFEGAESPVSRPPTRRRRRVDLLPYES